MTTQMELARHQGVIARLRGELKNALADGEAKDEQLMQLGRTVRARVGTGASSVITTLAGAAAGYLDGRMGPGNNKLGPVQLTSVAGAMLAILGVSLDDPDLAEGASAVARGFSAGTSYKMAFDAGEKQRLAPTPAPAAPAAAAQAKK
jgi:hypothetical protein